MEPSSKQVLTIGHSNRDLSDFIYLLRSHRVEVVADVRRFPGSRRYPHFQKDALSDALADVGIGYIHYPELGGRRGKPAEDSPNTGWRVESFAAYADYMATDAFTDALETFASQAAERRAAIMCSEAVPWRCHRRLIADALIVRGWEVLDIMGPSPASPRDLTPFARVTDRRLIYPKPPETAND